MAWIWPILRELLSAFLAAGGAGWWSAWMLNSFGSDFDFLVVWSVLVALLAALSWLLSFDFFRKPKVNSLRSRALRTTAILCILLGVLVALFLTLVLGEVISKSNLMDVVLVMLVFGVPGGLFGSLWAVTVASSSLKGLTKAGSASIQS